MRSSYADYDEGAEAAEVVDAPVVLLKIKPRKPKVNLCPLCGEPLPKNFWFHTECQRLRLYAVGARTEGRGRGKRGPDKGKRKPYKKREPK